MGFVAVVREELLWIPFAVPAQSTWSDEGRGAGFLHSHSVSTEMIADSVTTKLKMRVLISEGQVRRRDGFEGGDGDVGSSFINPMMVNA